jgi:hypothetical protein
VPWLYGEIVGVGGTMTQMHESTTLPVDQDFAVHGACAHPPGALAASCPSVPRLPPRGGEMAYGAAFPLMTKGRPLAAP